MIPLEFLQQLYIVKQATIESLSYRSWKSHPLIILGSTVSTQRVSDRQTDIVRCRAMHAQVKLLYYH